MNNLRTIRKRLGVTQESLAREIGCTQANVGHVESGRQTLQPDLARRVISFAARQGHTVTFNDLYVIEEASRDAVAVDPPAAVEAVRAWAETASDSATLDDIPPPIKQKVLGQRPRR